MARLPDKPGEWRVREQPNGSWRVSGMKADGTRFKQPFLTRGEADTWVALNLETNVAKDEWGLPLPADMRMGADNVNKVNGAAGIAPPPVVPTIDEKEKKARHDRAKSLTEFIGVAYAGGIVMVSRKVTTNLDKEPVNPYPKQVNDLADSMKDTLQSWFGEREIKPWQMTILLSIGIPIAMIIQSKPKEKPKHLASVP